MFKKIFGKREEVLKSIQLIAPVSGKMLTIEEVPDPVFSQKMMGDGVAFEPQEGKIVAPADGEIIQVFPTKHAIGIKAVNGAEILIHIGLETVGMKGEGFTVHVSEGKKVKQGDVLVTVDLNLVKEKASSIVTPMIITNLNDMQSIEKSSLSSVIAGEQAVMTIEAK
ncbi:PTS sugar transporter subunit IIA [Heyndrickxia ginsengihumi]|uniref:PTS sugar transporter subunit IIA n=1 Tax=Heyndrickxia ginsengihumi TaxID=363870 RepID=UPI000472E161|nr:PTS glucose transporter subunit IIA [Heyndrickxia ginsengihumi]MBE6184827.1 PTS glucose transporter subunit IIA [Bacillus sp. (in: firmicutes)]MCM3024000.1 PTS glucose transporter subunit IIA [Heyndrickxia ginsengihumi]